MKLFGKELFTNKIDKTIFSSRISIIWNITLALAKLLFSYFGGPFFIISGIVNMLVATSKAICVRGLKEHNQDKFIIRNTFIGVSLLFVGIVYSVYMMRLIVLDVNTFKYDMILGIIIAIISFTELSLSLAGFFNILYHGHYYRNIKIINLSQAIMAMAWTEVAIMSFAHDGDTSLYDGITGVVAGILVSILSIAIFLGPKLSLSDHVYQNYYCKNQNKRINDKVVKVELTYSKFYPNYYYEGKSNYNIVKGKIKKGKNPIWKWNIFLLIIVLILSEILIFVYFAGWLIHLVKSSKIIKKLDIIMLDKGYINVTGGNDV